jgi:hypothetical protein
MRVCHTCWGWHTCWLIYYLLFYVPLKNFTLIWRCHHYRWRAAKFRTMLSVQGLWAGRGLYRTTPVVTWDLIFSGFIWRTAPFSRLLWHTRGCGGSILTLILMGWHTCWEWHTCCGLTHLLRVWHTCWGYDIPVQSDIPVEGLTHLLRVLHTCLGFSWQDSGRWAIISWYACSSLSVHWIIPSRTSTFPNDLLQNIYINIILCAIGILFHIN